MKKILLLFLTVLTLQTTVFAQTGISFIYINGSNSNDDKSYNWFVNGIEKLHPILKKQFEKNDRINELFLKNGEYQINNNPVIFFWGDKSQNNLLFVKKQLDISKALSPTMAYSVRELLASCLHDAIWVQKTHNMNKVLEELNTLVKSEYEKGNNVVLYGYSAGSFVTYEYLFNRMPYLNLDNLFENLNVNDNIKNYVKQHPKRNTCIAALQSGHIGVVSEDGKLLLDPEENLFKKSYDELDTATEQVCMPENSIKGIVNFASPLVLFYSDLADPDYELTYYNKLMLEYILEKGLFWLTVNYREDPLGFPTSQNLTNDEMSQIANIELTDPKGFVFDNSSIWSKRSFIFAHTSYWSTSKTLAKAIVKTYLYGYDFQYDPEFQQKVLNSRTYQKIKKDVNTDLKTKEKTL